MIVLRKNNKYIPKTKFSEIGETDSFKINNKTTMKTESNDMTDAEDSKENILLVGHRAR